MSNESQINIKEICNRGRLNRNRRLEFLVIILFKNLLNTNLKQIFFCFITLTVQHNRTSHCSQFMKAFIFVVVTTQCQTGLLQEKSSTAQQVMRFMFPPAEPTLCLGINREKSRVVRVGSDSQHR